MTPILIVRAKRSPQGRFLGALKKQTSVDLGVAVGRSVLEGIDLHGIDQVIVGNILGAGQGMNIARQIGLRLGLPQHVPAFTVNMMCASGMQAVLLAAQAIRGGQANAVLCGGTESMSNAPFVLDRARNGYKLGDGVLIDSLLRDGLIDPLHQEHMALTAERLAGEYHLTREMQDEFAWTSQQRWSAAHAQGRFADELVAMNELDHDEHPRAGTTLEQLAALKPAFDPEGTVTPGNASGINDGAAILLLCNEQTASQQGWTPLATLTASAVVGCDPRRMGLGPVNATRKLCQARGITIDDFDTIELNEAFAAQALACIQELKANRDKVNPHGGAIAGGHPIGATGARLLVHLVHQIAQHRSRLALATLCVGGGMGAAAMLERK